MADVAARICGKCENLIILMASSKNFKPKRCEKDL